MRVDGIYCRDQIEVVIFFSLCRHPLDEKEKKNRFAFAPTFSAHISNFGSNGKLLFYNSKESEQERNTYLHILPMSQIYQKKQQQQIAK